MSSADPSSNKFSLDHRFISDRFVERTIVACFITIGLYNALELLALCFITFKRYTGCYFWSLLIAGFCIIPFDLGYLLIIYNIYTNLFPVAMELVAWVGMVTGQSLVLWSRLHLICRNAKVVRGTLAMIIIDAIILHIPGAVLELGVHSNKSHLFAPGFGIFERIQLIGFSVQETILSGIYSWEAVRLLNIRPRDHYRRTLVQVLVVNLAMILMDAAIIAVQFSGLFDIHVTLKAMVYSIKLKMEYAILRKLIAIASNGSGASRSAPTDLSDFVDLSFQNTASHQEPPPPDSQDGNKDGHGKRAPSKGSSTEPLRRSVEAAPPSSGADS